MSPPDGIEGPFPIEPHQIDELNRVFSTAFTDRYHRDGMAGVRVPELNPAIWRFAIAAAGPGAYHWRDAAGHLVSFNLVHCSGNEGWMGPLAVQPEHQGRGLGRAMVTAGIELLESRGCRVIGLETMPRTVENIGFYSRLGFRPGYLTVSMVREGRGGGIAAERGSLLGERAGWGAAARELVDAIAPGLDFDREIELTLAHSLGDVTVARSGPEWRGFAVWHAAPLALGRGADEIRILKLVARDRDAFRTVLRGVIAEAHARQLSRVSIRCQTAFRSAYGDLLDLGFRVHWTDLRMVLADRPERPPTEGVVFSNWEI